MEEITIRNVSAEQVYDSYMGILRISPNFLDGEKIDDATLLLGNPKNGDENTDRKIVLSDSDGNRLGVDFIPRVRTTDVVGKNGVKSTANVINMTMNADNVFASKSYNVRATLIVNDKNKSATDRVMPIQVIRKHTLEDTYDIVTYPIESPHDADYFNVGNKLGLIDYKNSSKPPYEQLEEALFNKPKSWYDDNIQGKDVVKIDGKAIYTNNKDFEQVPILYTRDYLLGSCSGHTAKVTEEIRSKFFEAEIGPAKLRDQYSFYSRLDFVQIDKVIWDYLKECLTGESRHSQGRYDAMGIGQNEEIRTELFGNRFDREADKKAPILGGGVAPGTIAYHAMPFHRYAFHSLRQELRNRTDEGITISGSLGTYSKAGKITPIPKKQPGFINELTKEYILCDGKEITYSNYPTMNTENPVIFKVDDKGIVQRTNGKPIENTTYNTAGTVYYAIKQSYSDKNGNKGTKIKTPHLLSVDQTAMRFVRGLNWVEKEDQGVKTAIVHSRDELSYQPNTRMIEIVEDSDWGTTQKNITNSGNYRTNVDFKLRKTKHCHYLFYESTDSGVWNRTGSGTAITDVTSGFGSGITTGIGSVKKTSPFNYGDINPYRPFFWDADATSSTVSFKNVSAGNAAAMSLALDGPAQIRYSFSKPRETKDSNGKVTHYINTIERHTPVPAAGLFAWKLDPNTGVMNNGVSETTTNLNNGLYMNDSKQTRISTNAEERKNQLYRMNMAEGYAPISYRGGTKLANTYYRYVFCKSGDKGSLHIRQNRFRYAFRGTTGGYEIKSSSAAIATDIPRCLTSLPIVDMVNEAEIGEIEPEQGTVGNQKVIETDNISQPPAINLIPLFKI